MAHYRLYTQFWGTITNQRKEDGLVELSVLGVASASVGQGAAGIFGPKFGWRMPFLVVSIPAMVCAVVVWMCVPEVERGAGEKQSLSSRTTTTLDLNGERSEDEDGELEMAGRSVDNMEGLDDTQSCKSRRKGQTALLRTTLVASGDSPKQGLYVQLNNQDNRASTANTRYVFHGQLMKYYRETIHQHIQTLQTLMQCPSVLLGLLQGV